MIGKTLGHYRIVERLGEGGMGVVYKAQDLHLDRPVALKILPPEKLLDPEHKRRFGQEAKAASALNHPNIVTIYDIDQADGMDYIAMEYIAGNTLDEVIPRKGMRISRALHYAIQIADALARAHGAGIVHRDLKPTNVMIDAHGLVKIVDFGLAKLTETLSSSVSGQTAATMAGMIVGTTAYMSPEQTEGKPVDPRSDVFAFGSLLYEMLTGRKAFGGETRASAIASTLRDEPMRLSELVENLPPEIERIIKRCLRKDPAHRFQTMADLKVALEELKEESESGPLQAATKESRRKTRWLLVGAGAVLLALVSLATWYVAGRARAPEALLSAVPLTAYPGDESMPSFSPDGRQVAFVWNGEKEDNSDIYVKLVGAEPPLRLTTNASYESSPAWSPDGRWIAFVRLLPGAKAAVVLISPLGGPERILTETYLNLGTISGRLLAWSPDSRWLAMVGGETPDTEPSLSIRSIETGEQRRLTVPPQNTLGDGCPSFSPDGRTLAFFRWKAYSNSSLELLGLSPELKPVGEPRPLPSGNWRASSPAWTVNGKSLVFSAASNLWRIDASGTGKPQRLGSVGEDGAHPAISMAGDRLAYVHSITDVNIYRVELLPPGKASPPQKFIASTRIDCKPQFSPDGKKIGFLSERSGSPEVWVCDADGANAVQLTFLGGPSIGSAPRWSPDGQRLTFEANIEGHPEVYLLNATGGSPRRLTSNPAGCGNPSWSKDGRHIYFDTTRVGILKIPADGSEPPRVVTDKWGWGPVESPDGRFVYTVGWSSAGATLLRALAEARDPSQVLDSLHSGQDFAVVDDGVYFIPGADLKSGYSIQFWKAATGAVERIISIEKPVSSGIAVSPDRRWILYSQIDQAGMDLMLVENFR